jgi:hypothetical protein
MAPYNAVLANALNTPGIKKLRNKRVVLASASPRRSEILRTLVSVPLFYRKHIRYSPSASVVFIHVARPKHTCFIPPGSRTGDRALDVRRELAPVFV